AAPTLVYLCKLDARGRVNIGIVGGGVLASETTRIAGIVAAVDPTLDYPLGRFLPPGKKSLADDEIALLNWPIEPRLLPLAPDTEVTLTYKPPEHQPEKLKDRTARFRFA